MSSWQGHGPIILHQTLFIWQMQEFIKIPFKVEIFSAKKEDLIYCTNLFNLRRL